MRVFNNTSLNRMLLTLHKLPLIDRLVNVTLNFGNESFRKALDKKSIMELAPFLEKDNVTSLEALAMIDFDEENFPQTFEYLEDHPNSKKFLEKLHTEEKEKQQSLLFENANKKQIQWYEEKNQNNKETNE